MNTATTCDVPPDIAVARSVTSDRWARSRIRLTYLWRHGRLPDLDAPRRFTELVQRRKLLDRDPRLPRLADKLSVKQCVADRLGDGWVTPTLWHGTELPESPTWPRPFVVKSRHGSNQYAMVRAPSDDWQAVRRRARRWMRARYGGWLDEWLYAGIERGLLVEPFVGVGVTLPIDYKIYVFGGRARFIQVHLDREHHHRWMLFDVDWHRVSSKTVDPDPSPPVSLAAMLSAAERLGEDFDFVRIDFYEVDASPRFAEMTFYPGSGLDRFDPVSLDARLGDCWLAAARRR